MRGPRCLLNSRCALPQSLSTGEAQQTLRQLPPWLQSRSRLHETTCLPSRTRYLSSSTPRWKKRDDIGESQQEFQKEELLDRRWTTEASLEKSGRGRWPWDHEITDPKIMVHDGGSIEGPLDTRFVMSKLGTHESLRMVTPYEPPNAKTGMQQKYPLCKIVEKDAEFHKEKQARKAKADAKVQNRSGKAKEFDINWGSTDHDLDIKIKRAADSLAKGYAVTVKLSNKKKKKKEATKEECEHVLNKLKEGIEAAGGKTKKPQDGELGEPMNLWYEPTPETVAKAKAEEPKANPKG